MPHLTGGFDPSILDHKATNIGPSRIDIAYQRLGDPSAPPLLLMMGLAAQSIAWPDSFCHALVDHGLQIIRFDNRDAGLSTLSDMAADSIGLLDALGFESAHIVGASMGGQIAQTVAIEHPARVRSLTSMMSTTGHPSVGQPSPDALRELFSGPPVTSREQHVERMRRAVRVIGSPAYPSDDHEVAARAARSYDRSHDPAAIARQSVATIASGDRTRKLRQLQIPTLVIHGLADRLCNPTGARATAEAIPNAELLLIEGMGHDLPPGLRPQLAARIADFVWRAERHRTEQTQLGGNL